MERAYIVEKGARLRKDGARLIVSRENDIVDTIPAQDLKQLIIVGGATVTSPVLDFLACNMVDTVFVSTTGKFKARLLGRYSKNVQLRRNQCLRLSDTASCLQIARAIVESKTTSQRVMIMRHRHRRIRTDSAADAACKAISRHIRVIRRANSIQTLTGLEGACGRAYFSVFGSFIKPGPFAFSGRCKRPPTDPVNALLSFGYAMLANAVEADVNIVGLDPYMGALHMIDYGRPSLVCDLMEEYRVFLVDSLVLAMINKKMVQPDNFIYQECSNPSAQRKTPRRQSVTMQPDTMKRFIQLFERRMASSIFYKPTSQTITCRQVVLNQVRHFARFISGHDPAYIPFTWER